MFFILSKVLAFVLNFHLHGFYCLVVAGLLRFAGFRTATKAALILAACLPVIYGFTWIGNQLLRPLEDASQPPEQAELAAADGIIVLAGFTGRPVVSAERNEPQINSAGERFLKAVELARIYPDKPVWFAGYSGQLIPKGWSEDKITEALLDQLGLDIERFSFEAESRNTAESAKNMYRLTRPSAQSRWVLVTSATHMKRAVASFKKQGWTNLIPYPVDFITRPHAHAAGFSLSAGPSLIRTALHEHIGYFAYWLTGRI